MASKEILHSVQRNVKVLKSSLAENWRIRRHLALAYRILDRLNLNEGACNHLSAKAQCLKITQNVAFEVLNFGIFLMDFCPLNM